MRVCVCVCVCFIFMFFKTGSCAFVFCCPGSVIFVVGHRVMCAFLCRRNAYFAMLCANAAVVGAMATVAKKSGKQLFMIMSGTSSTQELCVVVENGAHVHAFGHMSDHGHDMLSPHERANFGWPPSFATRTFFFVAKF